MQSLPKISIIVAIYNEAKNLAGLIESIKSQSYPRIETIVIDGGSSDGTKEILQNLDDDIDIWLSEPDTGIYAAWNKALTLATGDFICFMGADDRWAQTDSVEQLAQRARAGVDLVCAKFKVHWNGGAQFAEIGQPWSWESLRANMILSHRGMMHNTQLFQRHGKFDESFKITGDYEFLLRCGDALRAEYLDQTTIVAGYDGVSFRKPFLSLRERYLAQRRHRVIPWTEAIWKFGRDYYRIKAGRVRGRFRRLISSRWGIVKLP